MLELLKAFLVEDEGSGLVEYALLVALIALAVSAAFPQLISAVAGLFAGAPLR